MKPNAQSCRRRLALSLGIRVDFKASTSLGSTGYGGYGLGLGVVSLTGSTSCVYQPPR